MGQLLIKKPWLPDRQGNFHKPGELGLDDLPDTFQRNEKLADQLGMKKDVVAKLAEKVGVSQDAINIAKELERHPELLAEFRKRLQPVAPDNGSSELETGPAKIDYRKELEQIFNRPGKTELQERASDDGEVRYPGRRREKSYEEHRSQLQNEPSVDERRKKTIRTILEGPNEQVREYLYQMYRGKCQICGKTFPERDGKPFFVANYIVHRKVARAVDASANALCLCAEHFAKWQHGAIETENVIEQIESYKTKAEAGIDSPTLIIKLCGEDCKIIYKEKHLLDLQEFFRASEKNKGDTSLSA